MAFHIPQELMNNNPLSKDVVTKRFNDKGYTIIDYTYQNNRTRMTCFDKEGYKVKVSLDSLRKNVKQYQRFSLTCNAENFVYNANLYGSQHDIPSKVVGTRASKIKNHTDVLCVCKCGNEFWCDFGLWKTMAKVQCNSCSKIQSNLECLTQQYLDTLGVEYITQYKFPECRNVRALPFDFYIPKHNLCIEVDGEGHYFSRFHQQHTKDKAKQEKMFRQTQRNDAIKTQYCKDNNIKLLRLKYTLYRSGNKLLDKYKTAIDKQLALG